MKFDRAGLKNFRADFNAHMKSFNEKYGVDVSIGAISFDANQFHTKMTVKSTDADAIAATAAKALEALKFNCRVNNIDPKVLTEHVIFAGDNYKVIAFKRTNATIERKSDGKLFSAPIDQIARSHPYKSM